ncbi:MAG TPA: sugar nucleotide-binding protein, partial [Rhodanobacteraceae bacterium]
MNPSARILLLGANGQVGQALQFTLRHTARRLDPRFCHASCDCGERSGDPPEGRLILATRNGKLENGIECERVDLSDSDGMRQALDRIAPDLIVNAAAYTAVDRAEDEPE